MAEPHALSQLNPDRDKILRFSGSKNFLGASGEITSAGNGFTFGATANTNAPPESLSVSYSHDAAYQQYLQRVLDTTVNQGLINRNNNRGSLVNGLSSESSNTMKGPTEYFLTSAYSDEAAYFLRYPVSAVYVTLLI